MNLSWLTLKKKIYPMEPGMLRYKDVYTHLFDFELKKKEIFA